MSFGASVASRIEIGPGAADGRCGDAMIAAATTNAEVAATGENRRVARQARICDLRLLREQFILARDEPSGAPLREQVLQAPLGARVGIDRERPRDHRFELGAILALH